MYVRLQAHTENMSYSLLFHSNNGWTNAPQYYVLPTLPVSLVIAKPLVLFQTLCVYIMKGGLGLVQINIVACLFFSLCPLNICFQDIGDRVCSSYVLKINWRFTMATCVKVLRFSVAMGNLGLVDIVLARRIDIGRFINWRKFSVPKPDLF